MNVIYIHTHDMGIYNQAYGASPTTPHIRTFAERGTTFRQAYCVNPTCSASRAAMLTGVYPHECGMTGLAHRGFSLKDPSCHLANVLKTNGWQTVLCGTQHEIQKDRPKDLGYQTILEAKQDAKPFHGVMHNDIKNAEAVCEFLQNRKKDKPLYLAFGMSITHRPYVEQDIGLDHNYSDVPNQFPDRARIRKDYTNYAASAKVMDYCVGLVMKKLDEEGYFEDSFIFFTTDHGIAFPHYKCTLYDGGIRVSLIAHAPSNKKVGCATDALVSHLDVFPTIMDYVKIKPVHDLRGQSFKKILDGQSDELHDEIYSYINYHAAYEPMRCIRTKRFKYIRYFGTFPRTIAPNVDHGESKRFLFNETDFFIRPHLKEALFDCYLDPGESNNVLDDPNYQKTATMLKERLHENMVKTDDPLLFGKVEKPSCALVDRPYTVAPDYKAKIGLIVAMAQNRVIGDGLKIPWKIKGEQKRFAELTTGKTIIMGRLTYESIGKPLPNRYTIVISKTQSFEAENCTTVDSLYDALLMAKDHNEVYIAGGQKVYEQSLPFADALYITTIGRPYEGDVFFPTFDESEFKCTYEQNIQGPIPYVYATYERIL